MESDENCERRHAIIIDNGSCFIKAGLSTEETPKSHFRTCIGYPKNSEIYYKDYYIGNKLKGQMNELSLHYPIKEGSIQNWDEMEKIWNYIFYEELCVDDLSEYNIVLTQPIMNKKEEKEKMAQIMFESFNIPAIYIGYSVDLSFYSMGKLTGLSVDLGGESTQISAIFDGYPIPFQFERLYYGGNKITDYLFELFNFNSKMFYNDKNKCCVEDIKEKACNVALDYEEELKYLEFYEYTLPDNTNLIIKEERIKATEAIFQPLLIGKDKEMGLHYICNKIIEKCGDKKNDIYNCICLSGGNSLFNGLSERLTKEIRAIVSEYYKENVRVNNPYGDARFSAFIGAIILSEIKTFNEILTTKEMYEEYGSSIIYKKDPYIFK